MSKTIAVVGAGPQIGMAVAERFGREGFNVALIARNRTRLEEFVEQLAAQGVDAAAFSADVTDDTGLSGALSQAIEKFGSIDVLYYGPVPDLRPDILARPRDVTVENTWHHLELNVRGAITSVQAVLPGMLERQEGTLVFCGGASSANTVITHGNYAIAGAGLRKYARNLARDLENDGIFSSYVMVAGGVIPDGQTVEDMVAAMPDDVAPEDAGGTPDVGAFPLVRPSEVSEVVWDIHATRAPDETYVGGIDTIRQMADDRKI